MGLCREVSERDGKELRSDFRGTSWWQLSAVRHLLGVNTIIPFSRILDYSTR